MEEKEVSYINVIPFVDIMLVLLTIVLTTSTFIATGGIAVQLPKASARSAETARVQTIEIDKSGAIFFKGARTTLDGLRATLLPLDRATPFIIRADRELALQDFVDVLDMVKASGFAKASLQTERR